MGYVNGAEGYKIYRSTKKAGKYTLIKTVKLGKVTSYTNKNLKLGNTYYYKIKAVDTVNGKKTYSRKFSNIASVKLEQCVPAYDIEFPEKLNEDGSLTVTVTNRSEKEIQLSASPLIFNNLDDWSKDGILLKAVKYDNTTNQSTVTEDLDFPYALMKGETVKATYVLNKELQGVISGLKGEEAPPVINYKAGGEGFALGITYRGVFMYMSIQYPDGQKLMTVDEYLQKVIDSVYPAEAA